ncbi:MAG: right-handed parallel beta-helix repeat-containing protein [Bacteroidota bacterium]
MIIVDRHARRRQSLKYWGRGLLALLLLIAIGWQLAPTYLVWTTTNQYPALLFCDAERVWHKSFISNGQYFEGGHRRSDKQAFNGRYSSYIDAGAGVQYGFSGTIPEVVAGQRYRATVWFKTEAAGGTGGLAIQSPGTSDFYRGANEATPARDGWRRLQLSIDIPSPFPLRELQVYTYSNGVGRVYFDDLQVELLTEGDSLLNTSVPSFAARSLRLELDRKGMQKIQDKRDEAYKRGILVTDEDSWVKAKLVEEEASVPVKIRLKGDWTDHLEKNKWSFRVKVKDPYAWNRIIVFSLHTPKARSFADEWLLHQLFEREDVLTTRYDFVQLSLNETPLGVYAYEEHFDKQLLEFRNRREGPIIRFVEDALWASRVRAVENGVSDYRPHIAQPSVADIQPFKASRTAASPKLRADFELARSLLHQYQEGLVAADAVFDLERTGKYFAICDLLGSYHGSIWHNQRYYYNPVTSKLEPIGYDGFSNYPFPGLYLLGEPNVSHTQSRSIPALKFLMEDSEFLHHYLYYLDRFSSREYLDSLFLDLGEGLDQRVALINQEFPDYRFNRKQLYQRAQLVQTKLRPYAEHSIRAYWTEDEAGAPVLQVRNFHQIPLEMVGASTISQEMTYPLERSVMLSGYYFGFPLKAHEVDVPVNARYVFFKAYGAETVYRTEISKWSAQLSPVPAQSYGRAWEAGEHPYCTTEGKSIRFRRGTHRITRDIIIPAGYRVDIPAGTQLDFQRGSKFLSYSKINIRGTLAEPVRIVSTDRSARGFTILQAPERSYLSYAIFDHFNTLNDRGWQLTGAVTFYESDVDIHHCIFENNHCEDGLNLIRSNFLMVGATIRQTPSDGFDADFCEGSIRGCHFVDTGNDGIDVSGSTVEVEDCSLLRNGDKGISVGEDSDMRIKSVEIEDAAIGVASKDLSFLLIDRIQLKDCNQGFVAYQKKPEYGPSIINVREMEEENTKYLHNVAPACTLRIGRRLIVGER